jgi:hypothetical protein
MACISYFKLQKNKFFYFILGLFIFSGNLFSLFSIDKEKQAKIEWPLEMKVPISGSFAEFRNSHMHMGCDFKTFGINGFPVLSIFDSTIKTISYSEAGYGLSILLYSPSLGLTARYAHLNDLKGDVEGLEELKRSLLLMGSVDGFSVNLKPDLFFVKAKTKLARTGETGSGVSHLHLEIKDQSGYINPLILPNYSQNDITPPTLQKLFIDSDKSSTMTFTPVKISEGKYKLEKDGDIPLNGKVRFKLGGFDLMTSRNPNNVHGLRLVINGRVTYSKILDRMTFEEASNRDILYDVNKSSLSPAVYVYNFFNQPKNSYSIDLNSLADKTKINVELILSDVSGNESSLLLPIIVDKNLKLNSSNPKNNKVFFSEDKKVSLDTTRAIVTGDGFFQIRKLAALDEDLKYNGFTPSGDIYEIEANNVIWKGNMNGTYEGNFPDKSDSLYIYDRNLKRWIPLKTNKSGNKATFQTNRVGILTMMRDKSPPTINYPYLIHRDFNLPDLKDKNMIEVFYSISDRGSGVSTRTVLLEGMNYPYEYDRDREYIKLEIPKSLKKLKSHVVVQIKLQDWAGNNSDWFADVIKLDQEKKD